MSAWPSASLPRATTSTASLAAFSAALLGIGGSAVEAAPVYLNNTLIDVSVGDRTSPGTMNNTFAGGQTIEKVIDAPTAGAEEHHNQKTHIWFKADRPGGGLELWFDFRISYDITMLHFWNYTGEGYDVDQIDFTFFDDDRREVGRLTVEPALGSSPGIRAEDIPLAAPLHVRYVSAFLTSSNQQMDFQNIGFTATESIPVGSRKDGAIDTPLPGLPAR